jgi:hypothetical protein
MWHHFESTHHDFQTSDTEYVLSTEITRKKLSDPFFMDSLKKIGILNKACKTAI